MTTLTQRQRQLMSTQPLNHSHISLEAAVADPHLSLSSQPLLTEAERRQILVDWNDTAAEYPRDRCIHQLFEDQSARSPDAVAVVRGDAIAHLRATERAGQPTCAPPPGNGRHGGVPRGPRPGAVAGDDRRHLGDPQGRRRLRPA